MTTAPATDRKHPVWNAAGVIAGWKGVFSTFFILMFLGGLFWLFATAVLRGLNTDSLNWFREKGTATTSLTIFTVVLFGSWLLSTVPLLRWYVSVVNIVLTGLFCYLLLLLALAI
jgi:hypothetical protein